MKKKILFVICMIVIIACFIIIRITANDKSTNLLEAYQIAHSEALKWSKNSKPYFISSVDDYKKSRTTKGEDGKRRYWNFDFAIENTNRHLIITIHDKKISNKTEANSLVDKRNIINIDDLIMSTKEAVLCAKNKYGLLPGENWAEGYHFVLQNKDNSLNLTVVGLNKEKEMVRVNFNARTSEISK